jgi:glyoxylase-like metal-dependent hydrolase (beta-lactamase superfamily II)
MNVQALSEHVYYLPGGVNAALVTNDSGEAVVVDTGQDKNSGRDLRKACEQLGVRPVAIINSHAHADHFGGNDYLLRQFDIPVYAPPFEASLMQSPLLEPVYLFNGAKPLAEMYSKWLMAKPSRVDHHLSPGDLDIHGINLTVLDTSGHAHVQCSLEVDGVLLAADALFGEALLEKYPLPFGQDISQQIASAAALRDCQVQVTLPGHGTPTADLDTLVNRNLAAFERAAEAVAETVANTVTDTGQGISTAEVLQRTCRILAITMTDIPRYTLNLCTVMAYLSYLREQEQLEVVLKDNLLLWHVA